MKFFILILTESGTQDLCYEPSHAVSDIFVVFYIDIGCFLCGMN